MAKNALTPRVKSKRTSKVKTFDTMTLPDGTVLNKGMIVTVAGHEGRFKFMYCRLGLVSVFGGTGIGDKAFHQWRTFRPAQIETATANAVAEVLVAKAEAARPAEWATMTAGFKAAYTKRMNAAARAMPAAA